MQATFSLVMCDLGQSFLSALSMLELGWNQITHRSTEVRYTVGLPCLQKRNAVGPVAAPHLRLGMGLVTND